MRADGQTGDQHAPRARAAALLLDKTPRGRDRAQLLLERFERLLEVPLRGIALERELLDVGRFLA
jgi:hypothetical protein